MSLPLPPPPPTKSGPSRGFIAAMVVSALFVFGWFINAVDNDNDTGWTINVDVGTGPTSTGPTGPIMVPDVQGSFFIDDVLRGLEVMGVTAPHGEPLV